MFVRTEDGDCWVEHTLRADAVLRMPVIGAELPLAELYAGLDTGGGVQDGGADAERLPA